MSLSETNQTIQLAEIEKKSLWSVTRQNPRGGLEKKSRG